MEIYYNHDKKGESGAGADTGSGTIRKRVLTLDNQTILSESKPFPTPFRAPARARFFFLFFLLLSVSAWARINQNGDFQIWNRDYFVYRINEDWSLRSVAEFRWGDNASKFYYTYLQSQIAYVPSRWISLSAGYRQVWHRRPLNSNNWDPEYVPIADVVLRETLNSGWLIVDRNRLQYIIVGADPRHWVYRNRLRLVPPWHFTKHKINPFIEDEVFFREREGFNENRLSSGFFLIVKDNLAGQIYYTYRLIKEIPEWTYQNVLNITLFLSY